MPTYKHACPNGHEFDLLLRFSELAQPQWCSCGEEAVRVICAPMIFVQPNVCYDSPIDGRSITNKQARIEDLARNGCIEYDPEMKTDAIRRQKDADDSLDKSVEQCVEREIHQMPARKREKLTAELQAGMTVEPVRTSPGA